ncbi:DoxX family protein [Sodaliphilus sp.]|uniref:DoxX family protein n=1 Tax=Sodaliphilus sp. TaxID=2815818 RepID=UPI00388D62C4
MDFLKRLFLFSTGYTYSNLSRLFLRLFTGVMFLQLCVRQMLHFEALSDSMTGVMGMSPELTMSLLLVVELLSATFIILGLLTRIAVVGPMVIMAIAEKVILSQGAADHLFNFQPGYPVMFIGIFIYILLAGPGKISLDYIISAHIVDDEKDNDVLENA